MIDDRALLEYFQRGLIPGPHESDDAFLERAQQAEPLNHFEWKEASSVIQTSFGFTMDWVPISYSNRKIAWWEGAATWISDEELPSIQLRTKFQKGSFLGYKRSDILAHEAIHAARVRFEEPQFEEILAYSTTRGWKRFLGPLFSRTWEPPVLMLSLIVGAFWPLIPFLILGLGMGWLCYRQWAFKQCCKKLSMSVVVCLTDAEIRRCAFLPLTETEKSLINAKTSRSRLLRLLRNRQ